MRSVPVYTTRAPFWYLNRRLTPSRNEIRFRVLTGTPPTPNADPSLEEWIVHRKAAERADAEMVAAELAAVKRATEWRDATIREEGACARVRYADMREVVRNVLPCVVGCVQ